jgi:hypothetical protein
MMSRIHLLAVLVLTGLAGAARGEVLSYSWGASPGLLYADGPSGGFIDLRGGPWQVQAPGYVVDYLTVYSRTPAGDLYTDRPFTLALTLTDPAGDSARLTVRGMLSDFGNVLHVTGGPAQPQEVRLGREVYAVTLPDQSVWVIDPVPGGPLGFRAQSSISVQVVRGAPEPPALLLAAVGLPLLALALRRGPRPKGASGTSRAIRA